MTTLLLITLLGATPPGGAPLVAVAGFNAVGPDAVTAGLLTQRFASGLARGGIQIISLAELARDAPEEQRRGLVQCRSRSEACLEALRASGVQALLSGSVTYVDYTWRFSASAIDTRNGATVASISEGDRSRSGLEQRIDLVSGRFAQQLAGNLARPAPVGDVEDGTAAKNVLSIAPLALGLGALHLEYERVLTHHVSVLLAPSLVNLYPGLLANPLVRPDDGLTPRVELSGRFYPNGAAPERCWMGLGVSGGVELATNERRYGASALVGCAVLFAKSLVANGGLGIRIDERGEWGIDGRLHLGYAF